MRLAIDMIEDFTEPKLKNRVNAALTICKNEKGHRFDLQSALQSVVDVMSSKDRVSTLKQERNEIRWIGAATIAVASLKSLATASLLATAIFSVLGMRWTYFLIRSCCEIALLLVLLQDLLR